MSKAYQEFEEDYLKASGSARRDGVPLDLLDKLSEEEKAKAENELLKWWRMRDPWAIEGLGHLRSRKALSQLYSLLKRKRGSMKAQVATAIWKINGDAKMLSFVLKTADNPSFLGWLIPSFREFELIDIILCLAQFPQKEARLKLEELTFDPRDLVSYNAKRALELRKSYYKVEN